MINISLLAKGDSARILGFCQGNQAYRQKLLAMGLTRGAEFTVIRRAPLGDPIQIQIRDFHLTLRKQEARSIIIEKIKP